jgi:hypothetical protein
MYCIRIAAAAERLKLNILLTLTLDPAKLQGADSTKYINDVYADFRIYLRRKLKHTPSYIRILEYQKNGNAHLHILLNRELDQEWVSEAWSAIGGGRIVDIRYRNIQQISRYLSKYLTKQMIECAPPRARRVTTSRDIKLLAKEPHGDYREWVITRVPITRLLSIFDGGATEVVSDADGYLLSFEVFIDPSRLDSLVSAPNVRSAMFAQGVFSRN